MKKVLVVGGGDYQLPLIKRIMELGHEAYCVDKNPHAPGFVHATGYKCLDVLDYQGCLQYAKELNIQAVMTYGATLTLPTVSFIGKALGLSALPEETAKISQNKYKIKKCLWDADCNIEGDFCEFSDINTAMAYNYTYPCVIKPCDGSGSKGVSIVYSSQELKTALDYAFTAARYSQVYVEAFISGEEYSVETFVSESQVYIYAIVKTTFRREASGEISYGHRVPSGLDAVQEKLIAEEVSKAIHALGVSMGSVNFDVIISEKDQKPYIIDCGIRVGQNLIGSHLVPLSRGVCVLDNTIAQALGESVDATPKFEKCIATRLLIYRPGIIKKIRPLMDLKGKKSIVDIVIRKQVGERLNPYKEKSDTCGWVIACGATPDEAESNAANAKELLKDYIIIEPFEE